MADNAGKYCQEIRQMMFVSGAQEESSSETTLIIEDIVQKQLVEILIRADSLARRRGTRSITNEDIIFLVRHDSSKVARLCEFLEWKAVRKNVKDDDDGNDLEDIKDTDAPDSSTATGTDGTEQLRKVKKSTVSLPWDVSSFFSVVIPGLEEDQLESTEVPMDRLRKADERTRDMTKEEYAIWTENRHASFTWRKTKKFRDWIGLNTILESRTGEDLIDILGFLAAECVRKLAEEALKVWGREPHPERPQKSIQSNTCDIFSVQGEKRYSFGNSTYPTSFSTVATAHHATEEIPKSARKHAIQNRAQLNLKQCGQ